jgi:hypothetical protein
MADIVHFLCHRYIERFITNKLHNKFHLPPYKGEYSNMFRLFVPATFREHRMVFHKIHKMLTH